MDKKRVIVDYKNITQELMQLLADTHPYGYDDAIIKFKNAKGETVRAVPLETDDSKYLVKVGTELEKKFEAFLDDDEDDDSGSDDTVIPDEVAEDDD